MPTFNATGTGRTGSTQTYTIPTTAAYRITAAGAGAGTAGGGGLGARIAGTFVLQAGTVITMLVGQKGGYRSGSGGTFVYTDVNATYPLIAAGGAGGYNSKDTVTKPDGRAVTGGASAGSNSAGTNGEAGSGFNVGSGAGWLSSAGGTNGGTYPRSTGYGGNGSYTDGGYGGGGGVDFSYLGGGGGGYSGGAGNSSTDTSGGGGGSYNAGTEPRNEGGVHEGHGYVTIEPANQPPYAPTLTYPTTGPLDRTTTQRFAWTFSDPDIGDTQSAYKLRHRPTGTSSWTTLIWVTSTQSWHDFSEGMFPEGEYEWQVAVKDALGVVSPFSSSGYFVAATPVSGHTITDPVSGSTIGLSAYTVTWSTPDQDAYQLQILDGVGAVVFDTGTVEAPTTRSKEVTFPDNGVTRTLRVRIRHAGLWSTWASSTVQVSYTPPPVAALTTVGDDTTGSITITPGIPAPAEGEPAVVAFDTWVRRVGDLGDGTRIARDVPPSLDHTWWGPASGVDYEFRIRVRGDNDTVAWSPWAGGPARYDESTYDAAAYA